MSRSNNEINKPGNAVRKNNRHVLTLPVVLWHRRGIDEESDSENSCRHRIPPVHCPNWNLIAVQITLRLVLERLVGFHCPAIREVHLWKGFRKAKNKWKSNLIFLYPKVQFQLPKQILICVWRVGYYDTELLSCYEPVGLGKLKIMNMHLMEKAEVLPQKWHLVNCFQTFQKQMQRLHYPLRFNRERQPSQRVTGREMLPLETFHFTLFNRLRNIMRFLRYCKDIYIYIHILSCKLNNTQYIT